jgi:hypothetical protein
MPKGKGGTTMPKLRSALARPLVRKPTTDTKAKLLSRNVSSSPSQSKSASSKNKKESAKGEVVHLHHNEEKSPYMTRPIPWWVFPEERGLPGVPGGPFPPGPFPQPFPFPIPFPFPRAQPSPQAYIAVRITGGAAFPRVNYTNYIPFYPGMTIRQVLGSTGLVYFGPDGLNRNVAGIPIYGNTEIRVRFNGRVIPQTLLNAPVQPGSFIGLELYSLTRPDPIPL